MTSNADLVITRLLAAPARAGQTKVLTIDGRSGVGKSTLARQVQQKLDAALITMEDLYEGWDGLFRGMELLASEVLAPLAAGQPAIVPKYDWYAGTWGAPRVLPPPEVLIVEGVGSGSRQATPYISVSVWMAATESIRKRRALERDGSTYEPHWERWAAQEAAMLDSERTAERADLVISTEDGFDD